MSGSMLAVMMDIEKNYIQFLCLDLVWDRP